MHVLELEGNKGPRLEIFSMLQEFNDVFLDGTLGLPLKRDRYFSIDLDLGFEMVSKTPYRASTLELLELKLQLQDLMNKGYVCPYVSPLGECIFCENEKWNS